MKIGNYIIYDKNIVINKSQISEIEIFLKNTTADAVFFKSITSDKNNNYVNIDGFEFILNNVNKEDFLLLNKVNSHPFDGFPYLVAFIKEELYTNEIGIINVIKNDNIKKISTCNIVVGMRKNKVDDDFIKTISNSTGPFYLTHYKKQTTVGQTIIVKQKVRTLLGKIKRKVKTILLKIYNKTVRRFR